jgi:DnaK suppressor protein
VSRNSRLLLAKPLRIGPTNQPGRNSLLPGGTEVTRSELKQFEAILKARQAELKPSVRERDVIAIERTADASDEVQLAAERELATRNLERESTVLRHVRAALDRIGEGTYGTCLNCEEEISLKRLNAVPWTPFCIRCQEEADYQQPLRHAA